MTDADELGTRLRRLEDERDISRLIASYGPAVDAGDADVAARLWATDGSYDVEGWQMGSRADVHAMVSSPSHQSLVANGCCHFIGPTVVTVTGESAVAVCESLVLVCDGDGYRDGGQRQIISCCSGSMTGGRSQRAPVASSTEVLGRTPC